ncbi:lysocardiolipin acyltransferase 1-like [Anabrus simplex]|uniref:lysocardiolipin acyltransferase 1-like n=1 Tax=Anabrus simplex TaxID=316456 RepID=UPI0035A3C573
MLGLLLDWTRVAALAARIPVLKEAVCWIQGLIFVGLWYGSICAGLFFLYCPLLPLLLVHQRLFRQLTDIVFAAWEIYPTALLECVMGIRVVVTGDAVLAQEQSLLIMNHRTRTDWNFLWAAMFHASQPMAHRLKFVLKDPIRHIPGPGWVMQLTCFMFIHRRWERDKDLLATTLDYFRDIHHTMQILLFPEGTDLTEGSQQRSHQFAATHGLERYNFVLHPKTTGFVFLAQRMRQNGQLDAVYDITVGYPYHVPQQETDLLRGRFPQEVHFKIKRFPSSSLPTEDAELKSWLASIWREKEQTLHDFYACGHFKSIVPPVECSQNYRSSSPPRSLLKLNNPPPSVSTLPSPDYSGLDPASRPLSTHPQSHPPSLPNSTPLPPHSSALYLALMFWTALSLALLAGLLASQLVRLWVATNAALFLGLSLFSDGTHLLEISLYRLKEKYLLLR